MKWGWIRGKLILLIFISLTFFISGFASAAVTVSHPALLFHDISETPGYQYRNEQPYNTYELQILNTGKNVLAMDFTGELQGGYNRINYRGEFALKTALSYQITKDPQYAAKVKEALLNLDNGTEGTPADKPLGLGYYSIAYDWIQPTLDPKSDEEIRDKLALMADSVYLSLNNNGKDPTGVNFPDFQGKAYPMVGIAGAALSDYTNPHKLKLKSGPDDWLKVGTDYLFVNDKLHSYDQSLLDASFDSTGVDTGGSYKSYILPSFAWWMQVYNHFYKVNPFEKYPQVKLAFISEIWESLPDGYNNDRVTNGNSKWTYHKVFYNLYNDTEKSWVLNFDNRVAATDILTYAPTQGGEIPALLYCVYQKDNSINGAFPPWTSHLDPDSMYQVFRASWDSDADWLSLITYNFVSNVNRDTAHHDQSSFEYYSRGDLLLADGGEDKYVPDQNYGHHDVSHNTVAIEDPRKPFDTAEWSDSNARGIYKGDAQKKVVTPVTIESYLQVPWIQFMYLDEKITTVLGKNFLTPQSLSSQIRYRRAVIYQNDYFVVFDRFEGSEPWIYDNIFRPTSQNIEPTTMNGNVVTEDTIGHVNGNLTVGNKKIDWLSLPYKTETDTGITTSRFTWETVNPYGKKVELQVVSVPDSRVKVTKLIGRTGGYDYHAEVYSPDVWLSSPAAKDLYRVTALLSRYSEEEKKVVEKISVKGSGNALSIRSSQGNDTVYAGSGKSEIGNFATDAEILFVRQSKGVTEITLLGGSYLNYNGVAWITMNKRADYVTARKTANNAVEYYIGGNNNLAGDILGIHVDSKPGVSPVRDKKDNNSLLTGADNASEVGFVPVSNLQSATEGIINFF